MKKFLKKKRNNNKLEMCNQKMEQKKNIKINDKIKNEVNNDSFHNIYPINTFDIFGIKENEPQFEKLIGIGKKSKIVNINDIPNFNRVEPNIIENDNIKIIQDLRKKIKKLKRDLKKLEEK